MKSNAADTLLFTPEAQNAFWEEMQPDARACLDLFETKERWPYTYKEFPELFIKMAEALPRVATLPADESSHDILVKLIPLLASMPFRQCVFAIHWLNHQSGESPIGWGALCYLEAVNICNNVEDHQFFGLSKAMVERMTTVMRAKKIIGLFSQWPLKSS